MLMLSVSKSVIFLLALEYVRHEISLYVPSGPKHVAARWFKFASYVKSRSYPEIIPKR